MGLGFQEQHGGKKAPRRKSMASMQHFFRAESEKGCGIRSHLLMQPSPHPSPRSTMTVRGTQPLVRGHKLLVRRQEETRHLPPEGLLPFRNHWLEP